MGYYYYYYLYVELASMLVLCVPECRLYNKVSKLIVIIKCIPMQQIS